MSPTVSLTDSQMALLRQLETGRNIAYSRDGEVGWLWPLKSAKEPNLADGDIWALRDAGFLRVADSDERDSDPGEYISDPGDCISAAGRAYLAAQKETGR